jgi:glyceraldehyde-3-phosphate dehydrogenase (NADP+)
MKSALIINNQFISTENAKDVFSPEDNSNLGTFSLASNKEIDQAYEAASNAFLSWKKTPAHERMYKLELVANALLQKKLEIASTLCNEIAKPMKDCIKEVERSAEYILFTVQAFRNIEGRVISGDKMPGFNAGQKTAFVNYEPYGVVLAISPFNYPINLAVTKIAPALVAGNTVVFKPAKYGVLSAFMMSEIFSQNLPPGVLNFISGESSEIGDYLVSHKKVSMVAFTGSTQVGRHIQKLAQVPLYLEMGGKDAAIILSDANIEKAVSEIIKGAFSYSAQRCTAVKRIIIDENIADKFIGKFLENIVTLKIGKASENPDITALIDQKTADYVMSLSQDAKDKGAKILSGFVSEKNLVYPTLIDKVDSKMRIYTEEPFGPVLPIIRVKNTEEAIRVANDSKYGLQADVFTENINTAMFVASELNAGTVQINGKSDRGPDNFPFPGINDSGMGVAGVRDAIFGMMKTKVVVVNIDRITNNQ